MTKKTVLILLLSLFVSSTVTSVVQAQEVEVRPNNTFCIHLNQFEEDAVKMARDIVNSTNGDWGCVLVPIAKKDRNVDTWKKNMDFLRRNHLSVILRIATEPCGNYWCPGTVEDAAEVAQFLSKLNPPTKTDNVVQLFNEINDRREWGGKLDPEGAAPIIKAYIDAIHEKAPRFKIAFGAFNPTAGPPYDMDEGVYLTRLLAAEKNLFEHVDYWISHAYSRSGNVDSHGRNSIRAYKWELDLLKSLGVKEMPVIIGETGRPFAEGGTPNRSYPSVTTLDDFWTRASAIWAADPQVVKVVPFILKDCDLFEHYSWFNCQTNSLQPFVDTVKAIPKVKGEPEQRQRFAVSALLPQEMTVDSTYVVEIKITNGGQAWISNVDGYGLKVVDSPITGTFSTIGDMQPDVSQTVHFTFKTGSETGDQCAEVGMYKDTVLLTKLFKWCYTLSPQPSLDTGVSGEFEIQFFDTQEHLVYKTRVKDPDAGHINTIKNVIIGDLYRVVVLKDYYLPTQKFLKVKNGLNTLKFGIMAPIDFNNDGKFTLSDILSIRKRLMQ